MALVPIGKWVRRARRGGRVAGVAAAGASDSYMPWRCGKYVPGRGECACGSSGRLQLDYKIVRLGVWRPLLDPGMTRKLPVLHAKPMTKGWAAAAGSRVISTRHADNSCRRRHRPNRPADGAAQATASAFAASRLPWQTAAYRLKVLKGPMRAASRFDARQDPHDPPCFQQRQRQLDELAHGSPPEVLREENCAPGRGVAFARPVHPVTCLPYTEPMCCTISPTGRDIPSSSQTMRPVRFKRKTLPAREVNQEEFLSGLPRPRRNGDESSPDRGSPNPNMASKQAAAGLAASTDP